MTGNEAKTMTDKRESTEQAYVTPTLFVVGSATQLLQDALSQRYREVTSHYTTYWG
jgi:hypothetical protein